MKQFCVYILASRPGGALYIGVTSNLARRIWEHREGTGAQHTRRYAIKTLVYYEMHDSAEASIRRESAIKRWPRAWKTALIARENPEWRDLYPDLA